MLYLDDKFWGEIIQSCKLGILKFIFFVLVNEWVNSKIRWNLNLNYVIREGQAT